MSRGQAARTITLEAFAHQMRGIVADTGRELLDEAPQAYKGLDTVLAEQTDLVTPVGRLLPLLNVKGVPRRTHGADTGARTPQLQEIARATSTTRSSAASWSSARSGWGGVGSR